MARLAGLGLCPGEWGLGRSGREEQGARDSVPEPSLTPAQDPSDH